MARVPPMSDALSPHGSVSIQLPQGTKEVIGSRYGHPACTHTTKEAVVKKFMVLYNSSVSVNEQMANSTPEQRKAAMEEWMAWAGRAGSAIVDLGAPMQAAARVSADGVRDSDSQASGYSMLQGESKDEIDSLLADHPHLKMPGASIDVFESVSMPTGA
jgi:hypothetical protein